MAYTLTPAEQEMVLSKCADETEWCLYCTGPYWTRYGLQLAEKIGGRVVKHQGGCGLTGFVADWRLIKWRRAFETL
jgi:hypothetical protein